VTDPENGETLRLRRIEVRLSQETRDGDRSLAVLTNLPGEVSALTVADTYLVRWTIETFQPDYTSSAPWARPRLFAYHQRNRAAGVGDLVPATVQLGPWRHRMSRHPAVPPRA
jgi:hypothetical protein